MCTYLTQRGSTYYFRRVIPAELRLALDGRSEFMVSLRTKDREAAKRLIPHHTIETDKLLQEAARQSPQDAPAKGRQSATAAMLRYQEAADLATLEGAEIGYQADAEREERYDARDDHRRYWRQRVGVSTRDMTPREAAVKDLLGEKDFDLELARQEIGYLRMVLKEAKAAKDSDMLVAAPASIGDYPAVAPAIARSSGGTVPIMATFDAYAAEQKIKPGTGKEWQAILEKLIAFIGHDDAAKLTIDDLDRWRDSLLEGTTKRGTARDPRTVSKYLGTVRATLNWAVEKRKLRENVVDKVVVRVPRKAKLRDRDFTADEAKAILSASLATDAEASGTFTARAQRWIPWLCAYTGARVNEISQLRGQDVRQVDGIWTIRITPEAGTVKANTARTVPLHEHLVEQGFPAVAAAAGDGPMFYDPSRQRTDAPGNRQFKKVGERLASWVREEVGISDPGLQPNHGWRHTFKTRAFAAGIPERVADAIQGHAPTTVSRGYGTTPLAVMSEAISKLPRFVTE